METPGCKSCKGTSKSRKASHWLMIILAFYLLFASIYGSIVLIKDIINSF